MRRHAGIAAALSILAVMTPLTACSNHGPSPDSADIPTVAISGASVVAQNRDNSPYVTMTLTTSSSDRLKSAAVDPDKVAQKVILTAPTAVTPPKPGENVEPLSPSEPIDSIPLTGAQATTFGPGSYGMWLSNPKKLKTGLTVTITLNMEKAGEISVQAPVHS
jgi:copper(I)-binding protein